MGGVSIPHRHGVTKSRTGGVTSCQGLRTIPVNSAPPLTPPLLRPYSPKTSLSPAPLLLKPTPNSANPGKVTPAGHLSKDRTGVCSGCLPLRYATEADKSPSARTQFQVAWDLSSYDVAINRYKRDCTAPIHYTISSKLMRTNRNPPLHQYPISQALIPHS